MKFAHTADCHIGGWREPLLRELNLQSFIKLVDLVIDEKCEFLLISGDLFNTAIPAIDELKVVVTQLHRLKINNIPVFISPGSHDYSPSGKTMLDVLENALLLKNVVKADIVDGKIKLKFSKINNINITGMLGKKLNLEKDYYENLDRTSLDVGGYKIFMFHSGISELLPGDLSIMDALPLSYLPKNFDYYAGGHIHYVFNESIKDYGRICYPGALFPNSFAELEKFSHGGFFIVQDNVPNWVSVKLKEHLSIIINVDHKSIFDIESELLNHNVTDKIVTIRLKGRMNFDKPSMINFKMIYDKFYSDGAYIVLKNTSQVKTDIFEDVKIDYTVEELENNMINEAIDNLRISDYSDDEIKQLTTSLLHSLNVEIEEGEQVQDFEFQLKKEIFTLFNIN